MAPLITTTILQTREAVIAARAANLTIGLVPTMGALHAGHVSLFREAYVETDFVAVSLFVNPTQFGPKEDLSRYPRPFEKDVALCAAEGVDLIFLPDPEELYPPNYNTFVEVHKMQDVLCGLSRPGHFRGVATVVLKLFNIVQPDVTYFGQKDAQQVRVIQQMVRDLDVPVAVRICPIVREPDGLALSSRNVFLSEEERRQATVLFRTLEAIRGRVADGERRSALLIQNASARIAGTSGARIDYVNIVDLETLEPLETLRGEVLVALAVFFGSTRLIDNVILQIED